MKNFDRQPHLDGPALTLRPLSADDLEALRSAASDPRIWAGHPARERHLREVFDPYFEYLLEQGGTLIVIDRTTETIIGCSAYYEPPDRPGEVGIGYTFLRAAYWGGDTNFALKRLMLDHVFAHRGEAWFHIDPTNIRSQKATAKLGAEYAYRARLHLGPAPSDWLCYRLTREAWPATCATRQD